MPDNPRQSNKKFVPLRLQASVVSDAEKRRAILSVKQVEEDIEVLIKALKEAQDFLNAKPKLSFSARQKLEATVQKGTEDLRSYQLKINALKNSLIKALKKLAS